MRASLRWILGIFATLAVAMVLVVIFFDWNWLKGPIESRLSAATGKQVHIDGRITGTRAWIPHIVIPDIRIDAPEFTAQPHVATIDSVTIEIDLGALLHGKIDLPLIDIQKPVLMLLRLSDGRANWDIAQDSSGPSSRTAMPVIGRLAIADGKLTYKDTGRHATITASIVSVAANGGRGAEAVTLDGNGTYREAPFTIRLTGGSLDQLRNTSDPYRVDAVASVGKTKAAISGTVTDPFKLTDMNLKLTVQGDNAEELYPIFGIPAPSTPPYRLAGTLDRDGKAWLFKTFSGSVGKSDLEGNLRLDPSGKRLLISGNLTSKNLDFADLGPLIGAPGATTGNRPVSDTQRALERQSEESDRVLPDAPLNLDEVRNIDADLTFKGEHIQDQTLPLEGVDLHLKLDDGLLTLSPLDVGVAGGRIDSVININARSDVVATDYDLRFREFKIDQFFSHVGASAGATGMLDGRIRLHGTGNSVRRSLGTSDGEASAIVDKGTISNLAADLLGLDVVKSLGLLISGTDKQIPMRCMVADFEVKDGIMKPRAFVLDTDQTLVTAGGSISLADETIDLQISGKPKDPTLSLGGPIEVGGSFKKPTVGLGPEAIARGGAAVALGALLTPLAAVVAFIATGEGEDANCQGLEKTAQTNAAKPPPGPARHRSHPSAARGPN